MHTVFALLCFVVVIHWLIFPYPSGLLHWHCGNLTIAPAPAKQPWWMWMNTSCEFIMNDCITTTRQRTTKPCAYFLGYTVAAANRMSSGNGFVKLRIELKQTNFRKLFSPETSHIVRCKKIASGEPFVSYLRRHRITANLYIQLFWMALCSSNRKCQEYVYMKWRYWSTMWKIKHYLTEENKVNDNKVLSYCKA